jgi:hypothetical protein
MCVCVCMFSVCMCDYMCLCCASVCVYVCISCLKSFTFWRYLCTHWMHVCKCIFVWIYACVCNLSASTWPAEDVYFGIQSIYVCMCIRAYVHSKCYETRQKCMCLTQTQNMRAHNKHTHFQNRHIVANVCMRAVRAYYKVRKSLSKDKNQQNNQHTPWQHDSKNCLSRTMSSLQLFFLVYAGIQR